jgi:hypothetical protein
LAIRVREEIIAKPSLFLVFSLFPLHKTPTEGKRPSETFQSRQFVSFRFLLIGGKEPTMARSREVKR